MTNNQDTDLKPEQYVASLSEDYKEMYRAIVDSLKSIKSERKLGAEDYVKLSVNEFRTLLKDKGIPSSASKIQRFLDNLEKYHILSKEPGGINKYKIIYDESTLSKVSILPELKGFVPLGDPRYIRKEADREYERLLMGEEVTDNLERGLFIKVHGASQTGKTSLLRRIENCLLERCYVAFLDFSTPKFRKFLEHYDDFANILLEVVHKNFFKFLNSDFDLSHLASYEPEDKCTTYLEDQVFKYLIDRPVILLIDNLHEVLGTDSEDFLDLLRHWLDNCIKVGKWNRVSLIITYSVEYYEKFDDIDEPSPLANIECEKIELEEFNKDQILDLAKNYGLEWDKGVEQATRLKQLIGGHPYLVNQALSSIAYQNMTIEKLENEANSVKSPFCYHLNNYIKILTRKENEKLRQFYLKIINEEKIENNKFTRFAQLQLLKLGLIELDSSQEPKARCELYKKYFQSFVWEESHGHN